MLDAGGGHVRGSGAEAAWAAEWSRGRGTGIFSGTNRTMGAGSSEWERLSSGRGVPCVIRDAKQRLGADFQWFPFDREEAFDKVAVVFSEVARV